VDVPGHSGRRSVGDRFGLDDSDLLSLETSQRQPPQQSPGRRQGSPRCQRLRAAGLKGSGLRNRLVASFGGCIADCYRCLLLAETVSSARCQTAAGRLLPPKQ